MYESRSFAIFQLWAKQVVRCNDPSHLVARRPETRAKSGRKSRSQSGEFGFLAAHDLPVKHISLKLHQPVIFACAAIGEKYVQPGAGYLLHRIENILHLKRDRLQGSTHEVLFLRSER